MIFWMFFFCVQKIWIHISILMYSYILSIRKMTCCMNLVKGRNWKKNMVRSFQLGYRRTLKSLKHRVVSWAAGIMLVPILYQKNRKMYRKCYRNVHNNAITDKMFITSFSLFLYFFSTRFFYGWSKHKIMEIDLWKTFSFVIFIQLIEHITTTFKPIPFFMLYLL